VLLDVDYLQHRDSFVARRLLVFTGPIDEFFGFEFGRLAYRGQQREAIYHPDADTLLPCGQINNPQHHNGPSIRAIEWKHLMAPSRRERTRGTLLTTEIPCSPSDPDRYEYPFPDAANQALFARYVTRARAIPGLLICGRLGEYRYYDMDQAIARALMLSRAILDVPAGARLAGGRARPEPPRPPAFDDREGTAPRRDC
jgi:UDP-galactopyranose mutase